MKKKSSIVENEIYTVIQCKHCKWKSNLLNREELRELGVPWYCDNCGKKATYIHEGTLDELKNFLTTT